MDRVWILYSDKTLISVHGTYDGAWIRGLKEKAKPGYRMVVIVECEVED
jgi:hypothetical protein